MSVPDPRTVQVSPEGGTAGVPAAGIDWRKLARDGAAPAVAVLALIVAYGPNILQLATVWESNSDMSHGYFVAPVALAILWRCWPSESVKLAPSAWGWVLLAAVLAARAFFYEQGEFWLETFTMIPAVAALVLAYGGWGLLRRTWPAVAYLVFMLSIPASIDNALSLPLQRLAATWSCELLRSAGTWVVNEGNTILIGEERLEVATACDGLAMMTSLSATVAAMVLLIPMVRWKRVVLLLSVLPIAVACNILRIAATAWLFNIVGSEQGRHLSHDAAGWLMMPLAIVLVGLELAWLSWLIPETAADRPAPGIIGPRGTKLAV